MLAIYVGILKSITKLNEVNLIHQDRGGTRGPDSYLYFAQVKMT